LAKKPPTVKGTGFCYSFQSLCHAVHFRSELDAGTGVDSRVVSQPILFGGGRIFAGRCLAYLIFSMVGQEILAAGLWIVM